MQQIKFVCIKNYEYKESKQSGLNAPFCKKAVLFILVALTNGSFDSQTLCLF